MKKPRFKYDVCLSFAGEDRPYVEKVAAILGAAKVKVFYDDFEKTDLWGKDLYVHLDEIYRTQTRYCVVFISKHYRAKLWTNHERRSVQARAFTENSEYLLPARFDDSEIPGILPTLGFISLKNLSPESFSAIIIEKIGKRQKSKPRLFQEPTFRRILFEGFDSQHLTPDEVDQQFGGIWLVGQKGHWAGQVTEGTHHLTNQTGADSVLKNHIRYYEGEATPIDLADSQVSVRVRIDPPNDSHTGGGLVFRADDSDNSYYAFMLQPGNSVTLAEVKAGKMSFLWSREIAGTTSDFVTLKITGQGPSIHCYVNNTIIHTVGKANIRKGCVGTIALSLGSFKFDDFSIYIKSAKNS